MGPLRRSRIEYVNWAVNWRRGCAHGCTYCYAATMAKRFKQVPVGRWNQSELVITEPGKALRQQLERKRKPVEGMILVSSSHDPFMPGGVAEGIQVVRALMETGLGSQTLVLTKAPRMALTALGNVRMEDGLWFGVSLTGLSLQTAIEYEREAESPLERLAGLREAARRGYRTWVSIEPTLPGNGMLAIARSVLQMELNPMPWIVFGKLNYRGSDERLRQWAFGGHWGLHRDCTVTELKRVGFVESLEPRVGGYWVKKELRET